MISTFFQVVFTGMLIFVAYGLKWNFDEELGFYGAYHTHPINQAIHFVFIPTIWWSFCLMLLHLPLFGMKNCNLMGHKISLGTVMLCLYTSYYLKLDRHGGGLIFSLFLLLGYLIAYRMVRKEEANKTQKVGPSGKPLADPSAPSIPWTIKLALGLNALGWYAQIHPGHYVFEGVKPALTDSLAQAFGVAPLFAFYEGLWAAGYAPELYEQVQVRVHTQRKKMCRDTKNQYKFCQEAIYQ
eukprot:gb/GEZN01010893.1/.p1 GENE.gb/GEZN01010893.1/~~gb/GEZN01010893.1/.p1  ORF type:complete len:240 (+),score=15.41 gb/GEZN01010893.1/:34-753(+)